VSAKGRCADRDGDPLVGTGPREASLLDFRARQRRSIRDNGHVDGTSRWRKPEVPISRFCVLSATRCNSLVACPEYAVRRVDH
jgi:hypothetical protein